MKQVTKSPVVMNIIAIPNVQKTLERLSDLLVKIEKVSICLFICLCMFVCIYLQTYLPTDMQALTEYLERERSAFPRFYFIGNEDLLDIIGECITSLIISLRRETYIQIRLFRVSSLMSRQQQERAQAAAALQEHVCGHPGAAPARRRPASAGARHCLQGRRTGAQHPCCTVVNVHFRESIKSMFIHTRLFFLVHFRLTCRSCSRRR